MEDALKTCLEEHASATKPLNNEFTKGSGGMAKRTHAQISGHSRKTARTK